MFTNLLPFLKIAAPVASISAMAGGVYFVASNMENSSNFKPLPGVYLLVKGTAAATTSTETQSKTADTNTLKDYYCELTLGDNKTHKDEKCALYKLNASTASTPIDEIDLNANTFSESQLATATGSITATSHHILKVSHKFYKQLSLASTTTKGIKLIDKKAPNKSFGTVQEISNLNLKNTKDLLDPVSNLFLARVKTPATATGTWTSSAGVKPQFQCEIDKNTKGGCNLYKFTSPNDKTNSLTKALLSGATTPTSKSDIVADSYVIVELTDKVLRASHLKNKTIDIKQIAAAGSTPSTIDIGTVVFDQVLLGKPAATNGAVFPLAAKKTSFLVEKKTASGTGDQNAFTDIQTNTKNYKCKFTVGDLVNYDNSCVLKTFPTTPKLHTYSAITSNTPAFVDITTANNVDQYLLTVDSNKLYNLKPDWSANDLLDVVVIVESTPAQTPAKTAEFNLLQEVTPTKATGKTKMLFVKYKTTETVTDVTASGKCSLSGSETDALDCALKKASGITGSSPNFDSTTFADFTDAGSASIAANDYFAVVFPTYQNIEKFNDKAVVYYWTSGATKKKIIFEIISTMGGSVESNKVPYLLEAPRS